MSDKTQSVIQLIVGLGNPGPEYSQTRHNAGVWFVEQLARSFNVSLKKRTEVLRLYRQVCCSRARIQTSYPLHLYEPER